MGKEESGIYGFLGPRISEQTSPVSLFAMITVCADLCFSITRDLLLHRNPALYFCIPASSYTAWLTVIVLTVKTSFPSRL